MSIYDYDLFVIGGGSGGVRAARLAGAMGKRVALAEEYRIGGTCVIRGCVPKKLLTYAAGYSEKFEDAKSFGWTFGKLHFEWEKLISAKNQEIARLERFYRKGLESSSVKLYESRAVFIDAHTMQFEATGEKITAEKILIATGSRPRLPDFLGQNLCISSNEIFDLETLPKSIVIVGGGYIAVEFANIFHGIGVKVALIYRGKSILRQFDEDLRRLLQEAMIAKGIRVVCNTLLERVEKDNEQLAAILSDGTIIASDQIMLALGRIPNSDNLGLEKASITVDATNSIVVNRYLQTSVPHIWAIGDVTNHIQLTPIAIHEAMCFLKTAFEKKLTAPDYDLVATAVFSRPEIGTVGFSEEEAVQKFSCIEIYKALFRPMRNTVSGRNEKMMIKLVVDGESRIVIGAHVLGPNAGELAQLMGIALKGQLTKDIFDATIAIHPTAAEEFVTMYCPSYIYRDGKRQDN
ncbi:MAG: glutathione reductase (NADPH) [Candidatus Tokpelaia sp. JSC188]|nr:MAG: glutathione reductase (NADPH) [Candidatus Tokpelaia sp. JSC188]